MVLRYHYPIHLGLAYILLGGYLASRIFRALHLPAAVGIIANGFLFSHFIQFDILQGRDHLQSLSFFLVLLTAGFELQISDLRLETFVFAFLPVTLELLAIAATAQLLLHFTLVESLVLGATLSCLGDGLVIPKMIEFKSRPEFQYSPMPRLVFTAAPLEASYVLTIYGVLEGLAVADSQEPAGIWTIVFANLLRIAVTLLFGSMIGYCSGLFIISGRGSQDWWAWIGSLCQSPEMEKKLTASLPACLSPHHLFKSRDNVEAYLMILCVALLGFGIGSMSVEALAPMFANLLPAAFGEGELFQPELLVIVIGASFAYACEQGPGSEVLNQDGETAGNQVLEGVLQIVGGVWTFGQLVLFSMLGSRIDVAVFTQIFYVLPLMVVGQAFRFAGVQLSTSLVLKLDWRSCGAGKKECQKCRNSFELYRQPDAMFCFLSAMPRATIQGALGPVPLVKNFFPLEPAARGKEVRLFIAAAARLYVLVCAVAGSILLDKYGPGLLQDDAVKEGSHRRGQCQGAEVAEARASVAFGQVAVPPAVRKTLVGFQDPEPSGSESSFDEEELQVSKEREAPSVAEAGCEEQENTLENPRPSSEKRVVIASEVQQVGQDDPAEDGAQEPAEVPLAVPISEEPLAAPKRKERKVRTAAFGAEEHDRMKKWANDPLGPTSRRGTVATGSNASQTLWGRRSTLFGQHPGQRPPADSNVSQASAACRRSPLHSLDMDLAPQTQEEDGEVYEGGAAVQSPEELGAALRSIQATMTSRQQREPGHTQGDYINIPLVESAGHSPAEGHHTP